MENLTYTQIFDRLWDRYAHENPSVKRVRELFKKEGESVENDHIAFRTLNDSKVNIGVIARLFKAVGYRAVGEYEFRAKKLHAVHFENPDIENSPRIFISELKIEAFSDFLQNKLKEMINEIPENILTSDELIFFGSVIKEPSYETYQKLKTESEYAAWLYIRGFRANHFTVSVNTFKRLNTLEKVDSFLKKNGFRLNISGGEIKGTPEMLLQQSSILADLVPVKFKEGIFEVPSCYYEFALRFRDADGKLFSGFHADSADKIFESTNFYKK